MLSFVASIATETFDLVFAQKPEKRKVSALK